MSMQGILVFLLAVMTPTALMIGVIIAWNRWFDPDRGRRSPLERERLTNLPGASLRRELLRQEERFFDTVLLIAITGPAFVATWAIIRLDRAGLLHWTWGDVALLALVLAIVAALCVRLIRVVRKRRNCRMGLEAEYMTAQNLQPLVSEGCQLWHDVPGERFNIDHVVVAPWGVFAIETKSRRKPPRKVRNGHHVRFDGRALHFPEHTETRPVEQASAQAAWLARELSSALGERVAVVPVIALPGWFVDTQGGARGDVIATNGKGLERFLPGRFRNVSLDETRRQRIGHAILRLYPSIGDSVL